ncbi:MAG: hypothetical protein PHD81_00125 [Candidatus Nanoarchaeia archaeon]|nr:hypothetical protein [Candidatus Nanoarchaeia archaeon]MDD5587498.1 hypothetical protein [Candidatus Nanoarchaeia archaeon]
MTVPEIINSAPVRWGKGILKWGIITLGILGLGGVSAFGWAGYQARKIQDEIQTKERAMVEYSVNSIKSKDFSKYFDKLNKEEKSEINKDLTTEYNAFFDEKLKEIPTWKRYALAGVLGGKGFAHLFDEELKIRLDKKLGEKGNYFKTEAEKAESARLEAIMKQKEAERQQKINDCDSKLYQLEQKVLSMGTEEQAQMYLSDKVPENYCSNLSPEDMKLEKKKFYDIYNKFIKKLTGKEYNKN